MLSTFFDLKNIFHEQIALTIFEYTAASIYWRYYFSKKEKKIGSSTLNICFKCLLNILVQFPNIKKLYFEESLLVFICYFANHFIKKVYPNSKLFITKKITIDRIHSHKLNFGKTIVHVISPLTRL